MQRWHMTAGLVGAAVAAAFIAPSLGFRLPTMAPTAAPEPVAPPPAPPASPGHVTLELGLDHAAVLAGESTERFVTLTVYGGEQIRRPLDLAVVMDTSGSMSASGKIDYARQAATLLVDEMGSGDTFSLVTFADDAVSVVPATKVDDRLSIRRAIGRILEGGGTNLYAGLSRGGDEVTRSLGDGWVGRVVLLSDGHANVGISDPQSIGRLAAGLSARGITVSAVGLGFDYNEDMLARLADLGGGSYDFVDDPRELAVAFADELDRSASLVARQAVVDVNLPAGVEPLDVLGWDAERTARGWSIRVGDVYGADMPRKIVVKVRVDAAHAAATMPIVDAEVRYHDLTLGEQATSRARLDAEVVADRAAVTSSLDKEVAVEASRAYGNWFLDQSTRAYEQGDVSKARGLAAEAKNYLVSKGSQLDDATLAEDAKVLDEVDAVYRDHAPSSAEGRRSIKKGKEIFLETAREKR